MYICPIYDPSGNQISSIEIDDDITIVDGRVSKGNKFYYKGIGVKYVGQNIDIPTEEYEIISKSDVFYLGYFASKKAFQGKYGIFQERYQPQFTDFIGSCGVKELSIIEHSMLFEKTSVDVIKSHLYDKENKQYWFELDYKCGRRKYLDSGFPKKLNELLEYMLQNNWNFVWDKDSITDISYNGLVTDVADIFYSGELNHKIGTIYSVLYSLHHRNPKEFSRFLKSNRLQSHTDQRDFIQNSIIIMKRSGLDTSKLESMRYGDIIKNYLLTGRNCGHCVIDGLGERIKNQYLNQWKSL